MIPEEIRRLAAERQRARATKDFALADSLRDRIRKAGYEIVDTPAGPEPRPVAEPDRLVHRASDDVPSLLNSPPAFEFTVQWVVQGWPQDVERGIESFRRFEGGRSVHHVVVEAAGPEEHPWPEGTDVVRMAPEAGWAAARNGALRRCGGAIVIVVDGSVEATGDLFGPIADALADPAVGVTGPFGIVTDDLREFRQSEGPDVDAVEGYLMAFRRELVERGLRFDEKFTFYRTADIELTFQVKAMGLRATVTPLPVTKHEHRMWTNTPEDERDRLSKRNYYRFLERWRDRTDLLVSRARPG